MAEIKDFLCTYDNASENNPEVAAALGLTFPDAYLHAETMAVLSKANKEKAGGFACILPFCHTVEAEAMGGIITLGNAEAGPRAKEYLCKEVDELLKLPPMDFTKGRIREVLLACQKLREEKEHVVLEIAGPMTILNVLIDPKYVFKAMRKRSELMMQVFEKLGQELLCYVEEAKKYGVDMISFADAAGGVNILGPRLAEWMVETFTYDFLKKLEAFADEHTIILLCPKTTFALLGTGKAELVDIAISGSMTYGQGCIEAIGKAKIVGQQCIKNISYKLKQGRIKEVRLK